MSRSKRSVLKIRRLIILIFGTLLLLIASTYAWFSTQRDIKIGGIRLKVEVAESMQISLDGEKWTQSINIADMRQFYGSYEGEGDDFTIYQAKRISNGGNKNYVPIEMNPVSTAGQVIDGKLQFVQGIISTNSDGTTKLSGITTCSETDITNTTSIQEREEYNSLHPYFMFDMYLRNISAKKAGIDELLLDLGSKVWIDTERTTDQEGIGTHGTGLEYSARVGMIIYENTISVTAGNNETQTIGEQIRGLQATNNEKVAIWEPNHLEHTQYVVNNNRMGITATSQEVVTHGIKLEAASLMPAEITNINSTTDSNLVAVNTVKVNYTTIGDGTTEKKKLTNINGENIGLKPNRISKVRVYIWLEGQDPDCIDMASTGDKLNVTLRLTKEETEKTGGAHYDGEYSPYFFNVNVNDTNLEFGDDQSELYLTIKNNDGQENTSNYNNNVIKYTINIDNPDFILKVDGEEIGNSEMILAAGEAITNEHRIELIPKDPSGIYGNQECNIIVQEIGDHTKIVVIQITIIGKKPSEQPADPDVEINTDYGLVDVIWLNRRYKYIFNNSKCTRFIYKFRNRQTIDTSNMDIS